MSDRTCSIDGCDRPAKSRGWCEAHYYRVRRTGDPQAAIPIVEKVSGPRPCSVQECETIIKRGRYCSKHGARIYRHGDPAVVYKTGNPNQPRGIDSPTWGGDSIAYSTMHSRLKRYRGKAADYPCVDCGAPAYDWSYIHGCPDEVADGKGTTWCHHLDCYQPRDKRCHAAYDAPFDRGRDTQSVSNAGHG